MMKWHPKDHPIIWLLFKISLRVRLPLSHEQCGFPLAWEGQQWGLLLAGVAPVGIGGCPSHRDSRRHGNSQTRFVSAQRCILLVTATALCLHGALLCPQTSFLAISPPQEHSPQLQQLGCVIIHKMRSITVTFLLQHYGL